MTIPSVAIPLLFVGLTAFASEVDLCPGGAEGGWAAKDPRARVLIGELRVCGAWQADHKQPAQAKVALWDAGTAPWARDAAVIRSGVVSVQRREQGKWTEIRRLRSPHPNAYGHFGQGVATNARWLAVLERRPQRIWIFDINQLSAPPVELLDVRDFAESLAMAGDQILVGGAGELRIYRKGTAWKLAERVTAPAGSERVFTGQIIQKGDLLVSLAPGINTGDGPVMPGRVDVFRRRQNQWRWESRLTPDGQPFGYECCVEIENGRITTTFGDYPIRFVKQGSGWRNDKELK